MARRGSEFEQEMVQLEAELRRLEAEYNMFFAGRLPRLPWETRARVEAAVKRYDRMNFRNTAERFRFGTVQARFASFCDLWERNLKAREEGRQPRRGASAAAIASSPPVLAADAPPPAPSKAPSAAAKSASVSAPVAAKAAEPPTPVEKRSRGERVVHVTDLRDLSRDEERVKGLYEQLSEARKQAGERPLPFDRFQAVVNAQLTKLGGTDRDVSFRVTVKNGKVTLSADAKDE